MGNCPRMHKELMKRQQSPSGQLSQWHQGRSGGWEAPFNTSVDHPGEGASSGATKFSAQGNYLE